MAANTQRDSVLGDYDREEEKKYVNIYFKQIDTVRSIFRSWRNVLYFGAIYLFCFISACVGLSLSAVYNSSQNYNADIVASVIGLMIIQMISIATSGILLKSILANNSICDAYVEYNILDQMRAFQDSSPAISLYFYGQLSKYKPKYNSKSAESSFKRIILFYYVIFGVLTVAAILFYITYAAGLTSGFSGVIVPWALLTCLSSIPLNQFIFSILKDGLEYHKRELFKSPVFSNSTWEEMVKKLANQSRFRHARGKSPDEANKSNENNSGFKESIDQNFSIYSSKKEKVSITLNPIAVTNDSMENNDSVTNNSQLSFVSNKNNPIGLIEATANAIQHAKTAVGKRNENFANIADATIDLELQEHEAIKNRRELKSTLYRLIVKEGGELDIQQFRQDLFLMQHHFHVYNSVLGFPFSLNAITNLCMLAYILYVTITTGRIAGSIIFVFEYIFLVSAYSIYQNITLLQKTNSLGPAISAFCNPLLLVCPDNKLEELNALISTLSQLELSIKVFGVTITREYCISLLFSLVLSGAGQIKNFITSIRIP